MTCSCAAEIAEMKQMLAEMHGRVMGSATTTLPATTAAAPANGNGNGATIPKMTISPETIQQLRDIFNAYKANGAVFESEFDRAFFNGEGNHGKGVFALAKQYGTSTRLSAKQIAVIAKKWAALPDAAREDGRGFLTEQ